MTTMQSVGESRRSDWLWLTGAILLAGLVAHSILLLTDHVIWDGWWYNVDLAKPGGPLIMGRLLGEAGRPLDLFFYQPFRLVSDRIFLAKLLGVLAWCVSALAMRVVLQRLGRLPSMVAGAVAVLAATSPVFELLGELSLWMNTACVLLFWLAWLLFVATRQSKGSARYAIRVLTLGVFFVSFNLNSQLVLFYAVAGMLFWLRQTDVSVREVANHAVAGCLRWLDFLILPVVFWIWKSWFTPTSGLYENYNQPSLNPVLLIAGYANTAYYFCYQSTVDLFASETWMAAAVVAGLLIAWFLSHMNWMKELPGDSISMRGSKLMALGGLAMLAAAAFPYIAVGQNLASSGWLARNCILCPLPIGLAVVGGLIWVNRRLLPVYPAAWLVCVAMLVVLSVGNCHRNYLALQAFGAKQHSIGNRLQDAVDASEACVVQLRDYFQIPRTIPFYAPIVWTYIGAQGKPDPETFVFETATMIPDQETVDSNGQKQMVLPQISVTSDVLDQMITQTTMSYALESIPRQGTQVLLAIGPGEHGNAGVPIGLRYLWLKWFEPSKLAEFVRTLTAGKAVDLPPVR